MLIFRTQHAKIGCLTCPTTLLTTIVVPVGGRPRGKQVSQVSRNVSSLHDQKSRVRGSWRNVVFVACVVSHLPSGWADFVAAVPPRVFAAVFSLCFRSGLCAHIRRGRPVSGDGNVRQRENILVGSCPHHEDGRYRRVPSHPREFRVEYLCGTTGARHVLAIHPCQARRVCHGAPPNGEQKGAEVEVPFFLFFWLIPTKCFCFSVWRLPHTGGAADCSVVGEVRSASPCTT